MEYEGTIFLNPNERIDSHKKREMSYSRKRGRAFLPLNAPAFRWRHDFQTINPKAVLKVSCVSMNDAVETKKIQNVEQFYAYGKQLARFPRSSSATLKAILSRFCTFARWINFVSLNDAGTNLAQWRITYLSVGQSVRPTQIVRLCAHIMIIFFSSGPHFTGLSVIFSLFKWTEGLLISWPNFSLSKKSAWWRNATKMPQDHFLCCHDYFFSASQCWQFWRVKLLLTDLPIILI